MAYVEGDWFLMVTFTETSGKSTTRRYQMVDAGAYADMLAIAAVTIPLIVALTDAVIEKWWIVNYQVNDAFALPAAAEIQQDALFQWRITDKPLKSGNTAIPAPKAAIMAGTDGSLYDEVDKADLAVIAYRDDVLANYAVSDGELPESLIGGHRRTRGSANS